ncbi:LCP family protein, partial [uncultured Oscillibacter sp.]
MADQMDGKGRPPKRRSRLTRGQKGLIAAAAVLAVALAGVLAWQSLFVRPDLNAGKTEPQETEEPTDPVEEIDWGEGTRPRSDGERKSQDYYTVLILGRDTGGGGNTDTMLLASYDVTNQKATVMSIPRDTMVNVSWDIKKINSVYNTYGGGDRGIQALYKEISQLVGFEPDYQVIIEWEAVGEIVDAMGGVWFDVPRNMNYDDPLQNLHIHQEKGYRLLTGEDAMEVLRYRHDNRKNGVTLGYPEGDVGRIKTQQAFLKAMVEQLLKVENVPKVRQFIQVFQDNVETNLTFQNILWFAQAAFLGGLKAENVEFVTMPGNSSAYAYSASISRANGEYSEASYVTPYPNELLELVNTRLSPYKEVFTRSDLDMMTVNADGSVSSSTGHLEDPSAANPRSYWQAQWTPQEPEEETPPEGETGTGTDPDAGAPETGGETGTPGGGEITDPGGAMDPGTGIIDPDTGDLIDPETGGIIDPGTGQILDPGTGQVIGQIPGGSGDPAAGE